MIINRLKSELKKKSQTYLTVENAPFRSNITEFDSERYYFPFNDLFLRSVAALNVPIKRSFFFMDRIQFKFIQ